MWRPPWFLIHAGSSTFARAMPTVTNTVSTMNAQMSPTQGRAARPSSDRAMPMNSVRESPIRVASGTASRPSTEKNRPGIAVMTPAREPPTPKAARASASTAPSEEMPERRLNAATNTAAKSSRADMTCVDRRRGLLNPGLLPCSGGPV